MKIKMVMSMSGVGFTVDAGEITDRFGPSEAMRIVNAGFAEVVEDETVEHAVKPRVREKRKAL